MLPCFIGSVFIAFHNSHFEPSVLEAAAAVRAPRIKQGVARRRFFSQLQPLGKRPSVVYFSVVKCWALTAPAFTSRSLPFPWRIFVSFQRSRQNVAKAASNATHGDDYPQDAF